MKKLTQSIDCAWWKAGATAVLLLVAGSAMGVLMERHWLSAHKSGATPLTAESMAARLNLSAADEARLHALLDRLHGEILTVVAEDPDSLGTAVRNAQLRIESALPPDSRSEFRAWMREHHDQLIGRMHGGSMDHGTKHGGGPRGALTEGHDR